MLDKPDRTRPISGDRVFLSSGGHVFSLKLKTGAKVWSTGPLDIMKNTPLAGARIKLSVEEDILILDVSGTKERFEASSGKKVHRR